MSNVSLSGGAEASYLLGGMNAKCSVNTFSVTEYKEVLQPTQTKILSIYSHFLGFVAHSVASKVSLLLCKF